MREGAILGIQGILERMVTLEFFKSSHSKGNLNNVYYREDLEEKH